MTRKSLLLTAVVAVAVATGGTPAVSHDDDHGRKGKRRFETELKGFNENLMALSTPGRGSFKAVLQRGETELKYRLRFEGLVGNVTQAHIHFGAHHQNGGISIWLCGTATNPGPTGTPACPTPGGEVEGIATAAQVIGPAAQGIAAGEFDEIIKAMRAGIAYVNVHSSVYGGGEIRGQIRVDD